MKYLVAFLGDLWSVKAIDPFFSKMHQFLLSRSEDMIDELIFDQWAKLRLGPLDVYESLPIASWNDAIGSYAWMHQEVSTFLSSSC